MTKQNESQSVTRRACARRRGFTLAEVVITVAVFSIFAVSAAGSMTAALRNWTRCNTRMQAEQNARTALSTIVADLRQALPDPDPGTSAPPTGYLSLSPSVSATGTLAPNANIPNSTTLTFTEPNVANYNPGGSGWSPLSPANYQKVTYYVLNGSLRRKQIQYTASGAISATTDDAVATPVQGTPVALTCAYLSPTSVQITVTATEQTQACTLSTSVPTLAQ